MPPVSWGARVHIDADTGRLFMMQQQTGWFCSTLSISDDGGATWLTNPLGCGHPVGPQYSGIVWTSRPAILPTVGYPNLVHVCTSRIVDSACATSLDGGLSFGPLRPVFSGYDRGNSDPGIAGVPGLCGFPPGEAVAGPSGLLLIAHSACQTPEVAMSRDDGLTWTLHRVAPDHRVARAAGHMAVAIDEAGTPYVAWIDEANEVWMVAGSDGGQRWGPPFPLLPPGWPQGTHVSLAAGAEGRLAVALQATMEPLSPPSRGVHGRDWHGFVIMVLNATTDPMLTAIPVTSKMTPLLGDRCATSCGDGVPGFTDVLIDAAGRPWASFAYDCHSCDGADRDAPRMQAAVAVVTGTRQLRDAPEPEARDS